MAKTLAIHSSFTVDITQTIKRISGNVQQTWWAITQPVRSCFVCLSGITVCRNLLTAVVEDPGDFQGFLFARAFITYRSSLLYKLQRQENILMLFVKSFVTAKPTPSYALGASKITYIHMLLMLSFRYKVGLCDNSKSYILISDNHF